uniref:Putative DNA polymerase n=1 Tax=viral metagenome TaxID=1070528 RepID=A0A6M3K6S2_9ZZZZ
MDSKPTKVVACDTENDPSGRLGQWSLAFRDNTGRLCIWDNHGITKQKELIEVFKNCTVVFHNYKWDARVLARNNMPVPKNYVDTFIAAYCMGCGRQDVKDSAKGKDGSEMVGGLGLKYLARKHLGMAMKTWLEIKDHPEMTQEYNADDSVATLLLWEKWKDRLPKHFWTIDMPLLDVLMIMEDRGILADASFLKTYAEMLQEDLKEIDLPLNAFSPQEVQSYVYGTLEIEPWRFTESGAPAVDAETLESINDYTVQQIVKYKQLEHEHKNYASGYAKAMDEEGRIHCEFKQTSTATGRLSSANPNLQNVAKKRGEIRKLFIAKPKHKMIRMDWKLLEFGMLAVLAKDTTLINAFLHGDVHTETAKACGVTRDVGKRINFLMQNGGTAWGMSQQFGLPIDEAKGYYNAYYKRFPALKKFQDENVAKAQANKKVIGPFGRERRLDALFAPDWRVRQEGEREAMTMPMQNGGAELVKLAMIDLHYHHSAPMLIHVHDELLFEIPDEMAQEYAVWLNEYVPKITPIDGVEFPVEVSVGNNWYECLQEENVIK